MLDARFDFRYYKMTSPMSAPEPDVYVKKVETPVKLQYNNFEGVMTRIKIADYCLHLS